jgi:uncharacterized protein (TIGR02996 family)
MALNQSQAFLAAIVKTPEDDTPRLVSADWLEENGDPERGQFIRLQVEAARLPAGKARAKLEAQAERVYRHHGARWLAGTGLPPASVRFRRGFPDELDFSRGNWEVEPEGGWDAVPEEGLLATLLTGLRSWPELRCVRSLVICSEEGRGLEVVSVIAGAKEYGRVSELVLAHQLLGLSVLQRLASSRTLRGLRVLSIPVSSHTDTDEVGDAGCALIAGSRNFARLEVLELERTEIGDAGAVALAGSRHLAKLRRLDLSHNEIGDIGALALAGSRCLRSLTELIFEGNKASPAAIRALEARFGDTSHRGRRRSRG